MCLGTDSSPPHLIASSASIAISALRSPSGLVTCGLKYVFPSRPITDVFGKLATPYSWVHHSWLPFNGTQLIRSVRNTGMTKGSWPAIAFTPRNTTSLLSLYRSISVRTYGNDERHGPQ